MRCSSIVSLQNMLWHKKLRAILQNVVTT